MHLPYLFFQRGILSTSTVKMGYAIRNTKLLLTRFIGTRLHHTFLMIILSLKRIDYCESNHIFCFKLLYLPLQVSGL